MPGKLDRRDFLRTAAAVGAGLALASCGTSPKTPPLATNLSVAGLRAAPLEKVRLGFIGVGGRGTGLLGEVLAVNKMVGGVEVRAVCDIVPGKAENAANMVVANGQPRPETYTRGPTDYRRLVERADLDAVYIATPWQWHVPMAVDAMDAGKHAFTEVPAATTLEDCWKLVNTSERTRRHCMMLENCCYGESELLVLHMVRLGLFGELTHGEGAYIHDLRDLKLSNNGEGLWRRQFSVDHDANVYPTHGLGPLAQYMSINRGDRFEYLVSVSSKAAGLQARARERFGPEHEWAKQTYKLGDMNTTIIRTARGRTIMVQHDTTSPRPYSRINMISGTKGTFCDYPPRFALSPHSESWESWDAYRQKYMHPLWKKVGELAAKIGGHGGMDFVLNYRLLQCLREGLPLDMDVYDAAAWSSLFELTGKSVAARGASIEVPDFTRGRWKTTPELGIVS